MRAPARCVSPSCLLLPSRLSCGFARLTRVQVANLGWWEFLAVFLRPGACHVVTRLRRTGVIVLVEVLPVVVGAGRLVLPSRAWRAQAAARIDHSASGIDRLFLRHAAWA